MNNPILKIGAVVLKPVASELETGMRSALREARAAGVSDGEGGKDHLSHHAFLILQPKPKTPGEIPPYVLPRGSRQYQGEDGQWHDARDTETGAKHADTLEPFLRGLKREVAEEAGVTPDMLARAQVREMGAFAFQSRTKGSYPIHWFVVRLAAADAAVLDTQFAAKHFPEDALSARWASLSEIRDMAARGEFSPGYLPVIEAALEYATFV